MPVPDASDRSRSEPHGSQPNRVELNPPESSQLRDESAAPPELPEQKRADSEDVQRVIEDLVRGVGAAHLDGSEQSDFQVRLVKELMTAGLKLLPDGRETGELKLITAAVKELRYAYRVFGQYPEPHKVTIFGSARTHPDHPDYKSAVEFGKQMAETGWMVITGAGDGIMKAGHEGPGRQASFGVAIRLPFETTANDVIAGDEKLINFRYFFTRKLMFLSQAEAVALFPGGFGTLDEAYETLTLIQTGKASMIPIVCVEHEGGTYWQHFDNFVRKSLLEQGMISEDDLHLYKIFTDPREAAEHIRRFYRNYHSSRYVRDDLVIRLHKGLRDDDVAELAKEFKSLIARGTIEQRGAYEVEDDHLELPRLAFTHTRRDFGLVRALIDRINDFDPA
ncbi:MAG: LOG family protein [Phycisphaerales bacterium]|nr:MAG: LOG family protein [Phycisphaerales bacterium]